MGLKPEHYYRQYASCLGLADGFDFMVDADLGKCKIRDKSPVTEVTSEPCIGHLSLAGVGDSRSRAGKVNEGIIFVARQFF